MSEPGAGPRIEIRILAGMPKTAHYDVTLQQSEPLKMTQAGFVLVHFPCAACGSVFRDGDTVAHVPLGPGWVRDFRRACLKGESYLPATVAVHWACATGDES